ncbi:multifunctional cyclase-dehydratase-3-O-methyl transferase tcmN [Bisporella sp. PMI_857]|nr:multifunctional cyclase-dehydratase-3-O-methyl transferase tcmN [Bisporella sp. PMI_857]
METQLKQLNHSIKQSLALFEGPLSEELKLALSVSKEGNQASAAINVALGESIQLLDKLQLMLTPPVFTLMDGIFAFTNSKVLLSAVENDLADHLHPGPLSITELASKAGCQEQDLGQIVNYLIGMGIFAQDPTDGRISNNIVSDLLRQDHWTQWRTWASFFPNEYYDLLSHLPAQLKANQKRCAASLYYDTDKPIYQYLAETGRTAPFHKAIGAFTVAEMPAMIADYPWEEISSETLCDVGAGQGDFLLSYLKQFPTSTASAFELPQTVPLIHKLFSNANDAALTSRLTSVHGGDFFKDAIPPYGAYLLKWVLHNWSDDECIEILKNLRKNIVIKNDISRIIVMETILLEGRLGRMGRYGDIRMLSRCRNKERGLKDYETLAERSGWKIKEIIQPRGSLTHILDLRPVDGEVVINGAVH